MAWANSKVFRQYLADILDNATPIDLVADTFKAALYNNTITPDPNVTAANSAYNAGQWVIACEVIDTTGGGTDWPAGGLSLAGRTLNVGTPGVVFWDATDLASGTTADLANATGCLVYHTTAGTVTNQGVCFNYFGAPNTVANGTFTIIWNVNGILRLSLV